LKKLGLSANVNTGLSTSTAKALGLLLDVVSDKLSVCVSLLFFVSVSLVLFVSDSLIVHQAVMLIQREQVRLILKLKEKIYQLVLKQEN